VALPKTYLETSVISYLIARPSRDALITAHQELTRKWWKTQRHELDLYVSSEVITEIGRGDPNAARQRVELVDGLPLLDADLRSEALAAEILRRSVLPVTAFADAAHIAIAAVHAMDFLVTWNCRHIANGFVQRRIARLVRDRGLEPPVVVTPEELMEG
jgi:hypothetical protein